MVHVDVAWPINCNFLAKNKNKTNFNDSSISVLDQCRERLQLGVIGGEFVWSKMITNSPGQKKKTTTHSLHVHVARETCSKLNFQLAVDQVVHLENAPNLLCQLVLLFVIYMYMYI